MLAVVKPLIGFDWTFTSVFPRRTLRQYLLTFDMRILVLHLVHQLTSTEGLESLKTASFSKTRYPLTGVSVIVIVIVIVVVVMFFILMMFLVIFCLCCMFTLITRHTMLNTALLLDKSETRQLIEGLSGKFFFFCWYSSNL